MNELSVASHGYANERAMVRQKKTSGPVRFELTGHTPKDHYLRPENRNSLVAWELCWRTHGAS